MWQRFTDAMKWRATRSNKAQAGTLLRSWENEADTSLPSLPKNVKNSALNNQNPRVWEQAIAQYNAPSAQRTTLPQASLFQAYGPMHLSVAELLWDQRESLKSQGSSRVIHVSSAAGLVAVFSPHQRMVQVRTPPTALSQIAHAQALSLRVMPESAGALEGQAKQGFSTTPLAALLWYWGQHETRALQAIPSLGQHMLSMRRFPNMPPSGMLERHLRLIHILSQSSLRFDRLLDALEPSDSHFVCPDLASLYMTGSLALK
jgi:hypothetical protein